MKEIVDLKIPDSLEKLADIFPVNLYIVGGKIRNHLMNIDNDDIDLCSSLKLFELEELFKGTEFEVKFRNDFLGTAKIICNERSYDYATLRKEKYADFGDRTPCKVEFINSVEDDFKRRDFSVNAIYYDIKKKQILDFCGGVNDLKKGIVRCVIEPDKVMAYDGLRILRMVRIACELNFKIDSSTFNSAQKYVKNLEKISDISCAREINKICDSAFVGVCKKNAYLKGITLLNKLHVWKFFGLNFDKLNPSMLTKGFQKYYGLLIDIIDAEKPASISYFLSKLLEKLQINRRKKEEIINIISGYYDALNRIPNKIYFAKYFENFGTIYEILSYKSKILAQKYNFFYKYIISHKIVVRIADLKVTHRDLAKEFPSLPRKSYDVILNMILSDIFEGKLENEKNAILKEIDKKLKFY